MKINERRHMGEIPNVGMYIRSKANYQEIK